MGQKMGKNQKTKRSGQRRGCKGGREGQMSAVLIDSLNDLCGCVALLSRSVRRREAGVLGGLPAPPVAEPTGCAGTGGSPYPGCVIRQDLFLVPARPLPALTR